jgi:hypothetical protein
MVGDTSKLVFQTADHEAECQGTCQVCLKVRRMVAATVANSISEIIDHLRLDNLPSAQEQALGFVEVLGEVPTSTLHLIGAGHFAKLQAIAERGLEKIANRETNGAAATFEAGLNDWYDAYPPHSV